MARRSRRHDVRWAVPVGALGLAGAVVTGGVVLAAAVRLHGAGPHPGWVALGLGAVVHIGLTGLAAGLLWRRVHTVAGLGLLAGSLLVTVAAARPVFRVVTMVVRHSSLVGWESEGLPPLGADEPDERDGRP